MGRSHNEQERDVNSNFDKSFRANERRSFKCDQVDEQIRRQHHTQVSG